MKTFKNIFITTALILSAGLVSCTMNNIEPIPGGHNDNLPEYNPNAVDGELLVKFSPSVVKILQKAGVTKSGDLSAPLTRSGVLSIDEILDLVDGYELERVFPVDPRTEDKAISAGFDRWYVVRFGKEHSVQDVAARMSKLGEVNSVQYNVQLHRANHKKAIPLTQERLNSILSKKQSTRFNDPLASKQWDLVNTGDQFYGDLIDPMKKPEIEKFKAGSDVGVEKAWEMCKTKGHPSIIVAIVDEGVDVFHEDLHANMWVNEAEEYRSTKDNDGNGYAGDKYGYNFVMKTGVIQTDGIYDSGHGTHVAGVIAAKNNNGKGISSIAGGDSDDNGVRIMSCQIFAGNKLGTVLEEVRAIKYAADNGAVILQCSWGYVAGSANGFDFVPQFKTDDEWKKFSPLEYNALDYFINTAGSPDGVIDGGIAVFAAGNESAPSAGYPGAYPKFVSVAATAADFTPSVYSNFGVGTTIAAPGGDFDYYYEYGDGVNSLTTGSTGAILSTLPKTVEQTSGYEGLGYGYMEGTSMACPHVSGVLALGLSYAVQEHKHFKAEQVIELLTSSAIDLDPFMKGNKTYYKYVAELDRLHQKQLPLEQFQGKMGVGMVNAAKFLEKIAASGVEMTFPNILLEKNSSRSYLPDYYNDFGDYKIIIEDKSIAKLESDKTSFKAGESFVIKALAPGQTKARIEGVKSADFVITVREKVEDNGWM